MSDFAGTFKEKRWKRKRANFPSLTCFLAFLTADSQTSVLLSSLIMIEQYGSGPPTNKKRNIREEDMLTSATLWNTNSMRGASFDQQQLPTLQPNTDSGDWAPFDQRITSNSGSNEFNIINLTKGNPIKLEKSFSEHSDGSDGMCIQTPHHATLATPKRDFPNKPLIGQLQPGYARDSCIACFCFLFLSFFFLLLFLFAFFSFYFALFSFLFLSFISLSLSFFFFVVLSLHYMLLLSSPSQC
jgi:hypothetical protein